MKKLKEGVTLLLPAKNEEPRIEKSLAQFKFFVDYIIVIEDGSTDRTVEIAKRFADKVVKLDARKLPWIHQSHLYNEGAKYVETEYILVADCDEVWDKGFLEIMKRSFSEEGGEGIKLSKDAPCFRFPRLNLPDAKDFPDYQVRLVKTMWTFWKGDPHSAPYFRGKKTEGDEIIETPLDGLSGVKTLDEFPILHLKRRTDGVKRPWWNE